MIAEKTARTKQTDPPFRPIPFGRENPQPIENVHDERRLERDAEDQRHENRERQPFVEPQVRIDIDVFVEAEQRLDRARQHDELAQEYAGEKQDHARRQELVDVPFFVRIQAPPR